MKKVEISSGARKDLKKLDKEAALEILKTIFPQLQNNPLAGKELTGTLKGFRSYHCTFKGVQYRILYELESDCLVIFMIATRENIYKKLGRKI